MAKLSELEDTKVLHIILFGPPKSGKTRLAAQLAECGFTLWVFDLEQGRKSLFQLPKDAQERINIFNIPDIKDYPIAIETCLKVIQFSKTPYRICDLHGKISCPLCMKDSKSFSVLDFSKFGPKDVLIFDSLTQLSNSAMNSIMKGRDDLTKPEWEDFRNQGVLLDKFLGNIQNSPYNVIVISHEQDVKMQDGNEKLVPVAGTRNFSRNTAKYFDEVVYMDIYNLRHRASSSTTAVKDVLTGSRAGIALEKEVKPSLIYLFEGHGTVVTQDQQAKDLLKAVVPAK
jgi:hypothetical protein